MARLRAIAHPLLAAAAPILFLWSSNRAGTWVAAAELTRPLLLAELVVLLLWASYALVFRDAERSALAATLTVLLLLVWGHLRDLVTGIVGVDRGPAVVTLGSAMVLGCGLWWLVRHPRPKIATDAVTVATALLVMLNLPRVFVGIKEDAAARPEPPPIPAAKRGAPDLYWLVLDGYGRADVLADIYDYDNEPFLAELRRRGFVVTDDAHTNYTRTFQALAATANLDYLDDLAKTAGGDGKTVLPLALHLRFNRSMAFARSQGYRIAAMSSGFSVTELTHADRYFAPPAPSEFEELVISTSATGQVLDLFGAADLAERQRRLVTWTFEHLAEAGAEPGPDFVFAHVLTPHPPFVFRADGSPTDNPGSVIRVDGIGYHFMIPERQAQYVAGYRDQIQHVNTLILKFLDEVAAMPEPHPVVVIQGDHGPGSRYHADNPQLADLRERSAILWAVAPAGRPYRPWSGMTPINGMRQVIDMVFGSRSDRLPDRTFFVSGEDLFGFTEINPEGGMGRIEAPPNLELVVFRSSGVAPRNVAIWKQSLVALRYPGARARVIHVTATAAQLDRAAAMETYRQSVASGALPALGEPVESYVGIDADQVAVTILYFSGPAAK